MEIVDEGYSLVEYRNLLPGDVFTLNSVVYMKTTGDGICDLSNGSLGVTPLNTQVIIRKAKLTLERF